MERIRLATNGRETTRLGYGCSSIMGGLGRRESLRLLEAAFDAGIRHFDVAPMYGYGEAESCLGEFLARHRGAATVTTKYGIVAPKRGGLLRAARRIVGPIAGPVAQRVPALKRRLARAAGAMAAPASRARFTPEELRASLESSLCALRTGFVDVWLLHEAEAGDLADEGLLRFLEDAISQGKIGSFGVGSESAKVPALLRDRRAFCRVVQHEWSVFDRAEESGDAFHIHHRALTERLRELHDRMKGEPELCKRWSEQVGRDLSKRETVAALMLKAALEMNLGTVVLVSSKNGLHIGDNVEVADDAGLVEPARRLYDLVQREGVASAANLLPEERR
ncbi:MAG TPA: aldo/keto reductase [Acidobacteriaceae bacterium]|nr:aldo/keto reductase [Acidobacteriaceae bacterium]